MKFGLFSEIQVPKPLDREDWEPGQEARVINQALEQIIWADKLGFDYVFEVKHHFAHEYSHSSAPEVILGNLAARTQNIRLGTGITHMPPLINHPVRVAERVATLDILSNGRVEFGTGSGATPGEVTAFHVSVEEKHSMWREATEQCVRMMTQVPYEGFEGKYFSFPVREVVPKPVQKPHPPLWMAASKPGYTYEAASNGMGSLGLNFDSPEAMAEVVEGYWERIRECTAPMGSAINPAVTAFASMMCCPTTEEALAKGSSGAAFFRYAISRYNDRPVDHLYRAFRAAQETEEVRDERELTLTGRNSGRSVIGSPAEIRETIRLYEAAHVDAFIFLIQCGDRQHEDIMASLELFAKEVMPEFKERHPKQQKWRKEQMDGLKLPVVSSI